MAEPCKTLQEMKQRIENGEDPEMVIPYHLNVDKDVLIEVYYYAIQVLPDGRHKEGIKNALEKLNAGR